MLARFELERGREFVSGLHWQALTGGPSEAKQEARQLAKQLGFDLAVWRTTGSQQVGFAAVTDGFKPGMLSAAAVVSKTIEVESGDRDFICATELPDGRFLFVAQADGVITPESDFIGSAEVIRSRMLEDMSIGKTWQRVIAPVMWGFPESTERSFADFIPRKGGKLDFKHSWWALRPVKPNLGALVKTVLPFVAVGVVLAAALIGYRQYEQRRIAQQAAEQAALLSSEPPVELPHPWKDKPRAQIGAAACLTGFQSIAHLWPGNWTPERVVCAVAEGTLTVAWKRGEYGWIKHLLEVEPKAAVAADGATATLTLPLSVSGAEDEQLVEERGRLLALQINAQQYGLNIQVAAPPAPPPMPGAQPGDQLPPRWREWSWSIKGSALSPESIVAALDGPGFRLIAVTAQISGGVIKWDLEGSQYVLP